MSAGSDRYVTDAEIDNAIHQAKVHQATKIIECAFDRAHDVLTVRLSTGATLLIPRRILPELSALNGKHLADVSVDPPGYSIWFHAADVGFQVETLVAIAGGTAARSMGARVLGSSRSDAKLKAVRENGRKGGRPMTMTRFVAEVDRRLHEIAPNAPCADVSDQPNPNFPAGAEWRRASKVLRIKIHGAKEIQVMRSWLRGPSVSNSTTEPRSASTATRLAREFADRLREGKS